MVSTHQCFKSQAEKGVPLQAKQADWLEDTDEEIDEQELEAHYSYMAKIQEVPTADSGTDTEPLEQIHSDAEYNVFVNVRQHSEQPESTSNTCLVEKDDSNVTPDSPDMCDNDIQTEQNAEDDRVALANLIANLKLDVDENKKIQKQLKKASTSLAHELKECKYILAETKLVDQAWEKHSYNHFRAPTALDIKVLIKTYLMPLAIKTQNDNFTFVHELKQEMHADLKYVESLENEIDELESDKAEFSNIYDILLQEYVSNSVMCSYLHSLSDLDAHSELQCLYLHKVKEYECLAQKLSKQTESVSKEVSTELLQSFAKKKHQMTTQTRAPQLPQTYRNTNPRVSTSTGVIHRTNVSRPQLRSTQIKDKVVPNNSQVKDKKTEVEDHPRISSVSNKTKSVTASNDSLKSRTSNVNVVCATCGKYVGTKFLNKTLHAFFKEEGIEHQTSTPRTPEQNGVVKRQKRTLVEAARTMLSASKLPLFFWAKAIVPQLMPQRTDLIIITDT
ncbi:integrase, catalytic region, zinc finger, CCHC-type containing protein [Tanacetum coccineum]